MSNRKNRRKRRPQASSIQDGELQQQEDMPEQAIPNGQDVPMQDIMDSDAQDQSKEFNGDPLSEKDQAVWDTFREENYEGMYMTLFISFSYRSQPITQCLNNSHYHFIDRSP